MSPMPDAKQTASHSDVFAEQAPLSLLPPPPRSPPHHLDSLWELCSSFFVVRLKFKYNNLYSTCFEISIILETGELGDMGKMISDKNEFVSCHTAAPSNMVAICGHLHLNVIRLKNPVSCTSHISSAQQPHVTNGYQFGQHRKFQCMC